MRTRYDEYARALEHELGRIRIDPDTTPEQVAALIADAEHLARHAVAARWLGEARRSSDAAAQRASREAERRAAVEKTERELRTKLGDGVNPNARYWLLTHSVGAVAFPPDPREEDFGSAGRRQ